MKNIIEFYKNIVVQIATPYSTGTGFLLKKENIVVTNEHVVRDNLQVVLLGEDFKRQLARVIYLDVKYDLAFLEAPIMTETQEPVHLHLDTQMSEGDKVIAVGHPFGLEYSVTKGIISNAQHSRNNINYFQHDAALNPGNSGGPLVSVANGYILGVNTFIIQNGNSIGFCLPAYYLANTVEEFKLGNGKIGARCNSCNNIVFEDKTPIKYCPHCGAIVKMPSNVEAYEPTGIQRTIEHLLEKLGHKAALARCGPHQWQITQGTASINVYYYNNLIVGDAALCLLPKDNIKPLYEYLLRENYHLDGLSFSVKEQNIILSVLIHDRYFNEDAGYRLFKYLFEKADEYDAILVNDYGALWKK